MTPNDGNSDRDFVDQLFEKLPPVTPSENLARLVAEIPKTHPRAQVIRFPFKSTWTPTLALVAAACVGFFVGRSWLAVGDTGGEVATVTTATPFDSGEPVSSPSGLATNEPETSTSLTQDEVIDEELEGLLLLATATSTDSYGWVDALDETVAGEEVTEETF